MRPKIYHRKMQLDLRYRTKEDEKTSTNPFQTEDVQSPFFGQNEQFESLIIDHIHHVGWVDDTASQEEWLFEDIDFLVDFMDKSRKLKERIEAVGQSAEPEKQIHAAPVLIHCSAGIGRTGTLVAIYNLIESLAYTMNAANLDYIQKTQNNEWVEQKRR